MLELEHDSNHSDVRGLDGLLQLLVKAHDSRSSSAVIWSTGMALNNHRWHGFRKSTKFRYFLPVLCTKLIHPRLQAC
ncbi:hypothetical protein C1H46_013446 [Malus baccata]|uniref:Uncharacterized protein n=1 Tax=Malus baccata TaxID=106549 RepID=A0A540MQ33_MALBA|nr:hypothetical protein C1H46_013446 [Malus baccata]